MALAQTPIAAAGRIEIAARTSPGKGAVITVADHGPGISPDDRARVFERFVQLDGSSTRTHGGTGLGLYLCRRLAELLEGDLELIETVGGGATFTLTLPRFHSSAFVTPSRPALFAGTQP